MRGTGDLPSVAPNLPGSSALVYRVGTHSAFFRRMLARLHAQAVGAKPGSERGPLAALTARSADDFTVALLDAWAAVADVLSFYQERIANEGFLRTATERRSLVELARQVGYELRPGLAASTWLAFTVEEAPGAPRRVNLPKGTRVASVPSQGKLPQVFETMEDFEARAEWNLLRARQTQPQRLMIEEQDGQRKLKLRPNGPGNPVEAKQLYLAGTRTNLKAGDLLLAVHKDAGNKVRHTLVLVVREVATDLAMNRTRVGLGEAPLIPPFVFSTPAGKVGKGPITLDENTVQKEVVEKTWHERDLQALLDMNAWDPEELLKHIDLIRKAGQSTANDGEQMEIFALRIRVGFFGHSAPRWDTLPPGQRFGECVRYDCTKDPETKPPAYPISWVALAQSPGPPKGGSGEPGGAAPSVPPAGHAAASESAAGTPPSIWEDSQRNLYSASYADAPDVYLERTVPEVVVDSWVVFVEGPVTSQGPRNAKVYQVAAVTEASLADYGLSARVTGLTLKDESNTKPDKKANRLPWNRTTAHVQSERLKLADMPMEGEPKEPGKPPPKDEGDCSDQLMLDRMVLGLRAGQPVMVSGELKDPAGVVRHEVAKLQEINHSGGFTAVRFAVWADGDGLGPGNGRQRWLDQGVPSGVEPKSRVGPLQNQFRCTSMTLNANLVPATHGETVQEVLGSGDATKRNQRFTLRRPPLTHLPVATPKGARSTLVVRVNGVLWHEVPSLCGEGPDSPAFEVRLDGVGRTTVTFGDGARGRRLPSGVENVVATYRSGLGPDGEVEADRATQLLTRPLGVHGVTNPLPATGSAAPDSLDQARTNVPASVRCLGRIVSETDFADFARVFAGVSKVAAHQEGSTVHVTVAGDHGPAATELMTNLKLAIDVVRDVRVITQVVVERYRLVLFNVEAAVAVAPGYPATEVLTEIRHALLAAFAFDRRDLGQTVNPEEVVAVFRKTTGVLAVDLKLSLATGEPMPAAPPVSDLLLVNPAGVTLRESTA